MSLCSPSFLIFDSALSVAPSPATGFAIPNLRCSEPARYRVIWGCDCLADERDAGMCLAHAAEFRRLVMEGMVLSCFFCAQPSTGIATFPVRVGSVQ